MNDAVISEGYFVSGSRPLGTVLRSFMRMPVMDV